MKILTCLPLVGLMLFLLSSCRVPTVYFFDADPYTQPYQTSFTEPLTVVIGDDIDDVFTVRSNRPSMNVKNFRKSLRITLYYMFKEAFPEVTFADEVATTGYTLHLYRIRPSWKVVSTSVSGYEVVTSTSFVAAQIRYEAAIFESGKKVALLDNTVVGEKTAMIKGEMPDAFRDGVRELCEDLYKEMLKLEVQTYRRE